MSSLDIESASVSLLGYLDTLGGPGSPLYVVNNGLQVASLPGKKKRKRSNGNKKEVDHLEKQLIKCSWSIATLLHSVDKLKETQSYLKEKRARSANKVVLANEILCLIAQYTNTEPISIEEAEKLKASKCKWSESVLKSSVIKLDANSFSPSLPALLAASTPAKLVIGLGGRSIPASAFNMLLPFRGRWHSLALGLNWKDQGKSVREALLAVPCANCPPPLTDGSPECRDHITLSSLNILTTSYRTLRSLSGLMKNIKNLTLLVNYGDVKTLALNFFDLEVQAPLLSELTLYLASYPLHESPIDFSRAPRAFLPKLRRVVCFSDEVRIDGVQYALGFLDGSLVEDLCLHILDPSYMIHRSLGDDWQIMMFLGEYFPAVKSLAFRPVQLDYDLEDLDEILQVQVDFLKLLVATGPGPGRYFPNMTHLSLELDATTEGINALLEVLQGRSEHQGPFLAAVRTVDFFTRLGGSREQHPNLPELLSSVGPYVHDVTIRTSTNFVL